MPAVLLHRLACPGLSYFLPSQALALARALGEDPRHCFPARRGLRRRARHDPARLVRHQGHHKIRGQAQGPRNGLGEATYVRKLIYRIWHDIA